MIKNIKAKIYPAAKKSKKNPRFKLDFNFSGRVNNLKNRVLQKFLQIKNFFINLKNTIAQAFLDAKTFLIITKNNAIAKVISTYKKICNKIKSLCQKVCNQFIYQKQNHLSFWFAIFVFIILFFVSLAIVSYDIEKHSNTVLELQESLLKDKEYDLIKVRYSKASVPRVFIYTLPKDFEFMDDNDVRKDTFIKFLLPLILKVNEEIMSEREQLLTINHKVKNQIVLSKSELDFLYELAQKYRTDVNELDELVKRVDKISVSLAIGQSVQETGWGTSYFLLDGNALFAEWTWTFDGMIPRARESNLNHRVRTFPTLLDSVRSYALILNSSKYYWRFRNTRATLRAKNAIYDGVILSDTLKYYSTTPEYISLVKKIIRKNSLIDFETSELKPD